VPCHCTSPAVLYPAGRAILSDGQFLTNQFTNPGATRIITALMRASRKKSFRSCLPARSYLALIIRVAFLMFLAVTMSPAQRAAADTSAVPDSGIELEYCLLTSRFGTHSIEAQCGTYRVSENPDNNDPNARHIELKIAVVPAINRTANSTPLTLLAGGPGGSAIDMYVSYSFAFAPINRDHDIVLVDQRGTGTSQPLECFENIDLESRDITPRLIRKLTRECLDSLDAQGVDPRFYTTSVAVRDLDQVRAALGYEQLNLYGSSYGTRVALHYMRRYPDNTRAVILDGIVPADLVLGPDISIEAELALDKIQSRCLENKRCAQRFPNIKREFNELRSRVEQETLMVQIDHPVTGEPTIAQFGMDEFSVAIRLLSYSQDSAALLPLMIHEAYSKKNYRPLVAQALMITESLNDQLSYGMHNAVVCTEDVPFFDSIDIDRKRIENTYLGIAQIDALENICKLWPKGVIDDGFKTAVVSDKPVLLLSGGADPVTPSRYGEQAAATLPNSLHIVVPDQGHGQAMIGCVPKLMQTFIDAGTTDGIDDSCAEKQVASPFFLTFSGPGA
jgi:pimeloyl-ACP methyl ester carboxylesterase